MPEPDSEDTLWAQTRRQNTVKAYEVYLARYPQGRHADSARSEIARMSKGSASTPVYDPLLPVYPQVQVTANLLLGVNVLVIFPNNEKKFASDVEKLLRNSGAFVDLSPQLAEQLADRPTIQYSSAKRNEANRAKAILEPVLGSISVDLAPINNSYDLTLNLGDVREKGRR